MGKVVQLVICLSFLWFALMLPANPVQAGDEDLNSSVYLVFDPETGEFVTVEDQDRSKREHEIVAPSDTASGQVPSSGQAQPLSAGGAIVIAIAIALLGVAVVRGQKKKHEPS